MANAIDKVNGIAIASIEAINGKTDANIQALNALELTGGYSFGSLTWTTATAAAWSGNGSLKIGTAATGAATEGQSTSVDEWASGSWSAGGSLSVVHTGGASGGSLAAGVIYAGYDGSDESTVCEEYNGTSWSTDASVTGALTTGHAFVSGGGYLQTAQIIPAGASFNPYVKDLQTTQTYNGSTWTNESVNSSGMGQAGVVGTADNFVMINGTLDGQAQSNTAAQWDGEAWNALATSPTDGYELSSFGVETRAFKAGGYSTNSLGAPNYYALQANVEMWVSDSWSTETALTVAQSGCGYSGGEGAGGNDGIAGWLVAGYTRSGSTNTTINTHYIAEEGG